MLQNATSRCETCLSPTQETAGSGLNRLYNVLCCLWNIHSVASLPRIYSITNTKHWITYTYIIWLIHIPSLNGKWASAWDFLQCGMCDQQSLRSACAFAQADQSLCLLLEFSMIVKLLTEHHLEEADEALPSLHLSKCQIVGNLMLRPQWLWPWNATITDQPLEPMKSHKITDHLKNKKTNILNKSFLLM